jgi:hypothetical protein
MSQVDEQPPASDRHSTPVADEVLQNSQGYIGQWNQLVSTTNWEKGRIICQWRTDMIESGAAAADYSDEAWAQLVGGVSGQHVGRLRRAYARFGTTFGKFPGLYWSHFQAALEWDDAEMWLEGAVQSGWSVAQMRQQRWETLGALAGQAPPVADDVVAAEFDEDADAGSRQAPIATTMTADGEAISGPRYDGPDFGDEPASASDGSYAGPAGNEQPEANLPSAPRVRPFESLGELPDDVADACERFKLVILKHRREGYRDISCEDLVASLEALVQLARAPLEEEAAPW